METLNKLSEVINMTQVNGEYMNIICMGDFNFPKVDWKNLDVSGSQPMQLFDFMSQFYLTNIVQESTCYDKMLDLILVSDVTWINNIEMEENQIFSDHNFINMTLSFNIKKVKKCNKKNIYNTTISLFTINHQDKAINLLRQNDIS